MLHTPKPDGTQGMATVEMTYKEGGKTRKLVLHGCFVEKDNNLLAFIEKDIKPATDRKKFDCTKYFFYTCDSELAEKSDKITNIVYTYHRFSKPNRAKSDKLMSYLPYQVFKVQNHIFLLCDSEKLNKCTFLKDHCKKFKVLAEAERLAIYSRKIYGISVEENKPMQLIPLISKTHESLNDVFQLEDLGPVLLENGKILVGSYEITDNGSISISIFGNSQDNENEDCFKESDSTSGKMVEEKFPLKETNYGAGIQEKNVQGPDNTVIVYVVPTSSDLKENSEKSAHQSKEEIKFDKQDEEDDDEKLKMVEEKIPLKETNHGAGIQEKNVQGPDNTVIVYVVPTSSDLKENSVKSAHQSKEEIKFDKQDEEDDDEKLKMVEEKIPLKETNHGAGIQEKNVQGPDNTVIVYVVPTSSDLKETPEKSAHQSKEEIKFDKQEKPEPDETVTNKPSEHGSSSDEGSQVKNQDEIDLGKGDFPCVSIEESGTKESNPLEEIKASLPNGPSQLHDDLSQNIEKYRRSFLHLAQNAAEHWKKIGLNLDVKDTKICNLKVDYKNEGVEEQAYQMLVHWRQSDVEPTLEKILIALIETQLVKEAHTFSDTSREDSRSLDDGIPVTEKLLNKIIKDVKDKWKFLGRYLALDESTIQSIKMDHPDDTWEQAQQMLVKWKQWKANHATTGVLMTALNAVGKSNVAKTVKGW